MAIASTTKPDLNAAHTETKEMLLEQSSRVGNSLWKRYIDCSIGTKLNIYHGVNSLVGLAMLGVAWFSLNAIQTNLLEEGIDAPVVTEIASRAQMWLGLIMVAIAGWAVIAIYRASKDITGSLQQLVPMLWDVIEGKMDMDIPFLERKDEMGEMARSIEVFRRASVQLQKVRTEREESFGREKENEAKQSRLRDEQTKKIREMADKFESTISDVVSSVASASAQLQTTATSMASTAEQSSTQTGNVARAMEDASKGVTAAAAASDEFAMSIGEISRQASSSAELARKAADAAGEADTTMTALSDSAQQVGQIVELIQSIAHRTNLLALNASIEAARGGEAGRGFAVVASEVKELASQTSKATQDVANQIGNMQESTHASVDALRAIGSQIQKLETTAVSIAAAVDQQAVAGQDLARSIDATAQGTEEVSNNIAQVRETSRATGNSATQVLGSATDLEKQAAKLNLHVEEFLGYVREWDFFSHDEQKTG
ncbi:methyl-accepting chemotaxis protein [Parasphingorhabdus sp.]|jgi:methyl-accepting chemotaxis protein|uniref:methyl-accepting chemotaxis protein n=1 Tax=Parasphingorhabdus sp. TaxID=2709688 RepID=UPI0030016F74